MYQYFNKQKETPWVRLCAHARLCVLLSCKPIQGNGLTINNDCVLHLLQFCDLNFVLESSHIFLQIWEYFSLSIAVVGKQQVSEIPELLIRLVSVLDWFYYVLLAWK